MKTKTQHTPTPWLFDPSSGLDWFQIKNEKREIIVKIENRDDAEFIVRAVNSHEALIKVIKNLIEHPKDSFAVIQAKAIVAQAEGK